MAHEWAACAWTEAGHDIENAGRKASFGKEPGKFKR
jgi:hypothetical protein